jgi:predicted alpha/beta hydrolase
MTPTFVDRGSDRLALHVYPDPFGGEDAPVVIVWPAMGVPARYYRPFVEQLGRAGLGAVVVDLRGTGSSTPPASRRSRYGYAEIAADVGAVLEELKPRLRARRTLLLGHSLGGQACVLHLALAGTDGVDGLILVAVGLPWFRSYAGARSAAVLGMTQGIAAASGLLGVWPGWGFGGRQARGVIRDWAYTARNGRFPRMGEVDPQPAVAALRTRVLAVSVEHDRYTPATTVDHLCGRMPHADVERLHLTGPADPAHFTWVRAPGPLGDRIARFATATPL